MKKYLIIIAIFIVLFTRGLYLNTLKRDYYQELLEQKTNKYVYGSSAPRGRILDCNGKVLVDNKGIKTIFYTKLKGIDTEEEIKIAQKLANIIDIEVNENSVINYWLIVNNNGNDLISKEEWQLYQERKLSNEEIKKLKEIRISKEELDKLSDYDKKVATIYDLMNKGYSYDKKEIIKNITDREYAQVVDANIKGITTELTWERVYNYGDVLKDILGSIGHIPIDKKEEYLKNGYSLDDIVGLSYLELQYEDYLKGEKDLYKVNSDNTLSLLKQGKKGSDLQLSIDIDVQLKLENTIKKNIILAKKRANTDYFSEVYSIVGNPNTGEILALSGQKLISNIDNPTFKNVNTNLINTSYTVGSVVKMATVSTGYKYGIIDIGTEMKDACIKLYQVPLKCSYKSLGIVNDMTAISKSSNYYQFKIAIGLTENDYKYDIKLNTNPSHFNKFRDMFKSYGLGNITNIDLPNETIGIIGNNTSSDLLLNLSIGQYDTYTPIELFQYVNTVATKGKRRSPQLMKRILNDNNILVENNYAIINEIDLEDEYLERLKMAMHLATINGTAMNYIYKKYNPAGKTGTSETFIDSNNDGTMDTKTTSLSFVGFAPYDNPEYSLIVLTPNIYLTKEYDYSKLYITRYISQDVTNFLFEKR